MLEDFRSIPMAIILRDILAHYDSQLQKVVPQTKYHSFYRMWLRSYVTYCQKSGMPESNGASLDRFMLTLAEQGKAAFQQKQAAHAVSLYFGLLAGDATAPEEESTGGIQPVAVPTGTNKPPALAGWDKVFDDLYAAIRTRNYSRATLKTYTIWIRQFKGFTQDKTPAMLAPEDVKNALFFLFRHILRKDFGDHRDGVRAKRKPYIPVVLSRQEVDAVLAHLHPPYDLVVKLLYG